MCLLLVIIWCFVLFFFFKQKTAYEMRISDWSSDVCSSDLGAASGLGEATARRFAQEGARVLLTDISDEGAAVARDIGGDAQFLPQDVANEARWAEIGRASCRERVCQYV